MLKEQGLCQLARNWLDKINESLKSEIILANYNFLLWEGINTKTR